MQGIREEFRVRSALLCHPDFASFCVPRCMPAPVYLIYRWVVALFLSVALITERIYYNFWYSSAFTVWGLITVTLYFDLSAILCLLQYCQTRRNRSRSVALTTEDANKVERRPSEQGRCRQKLHPVLIWLHSLMWALYNIAAVNSLIVTIGYWALLHSKYGRASLVGQKGFHNVTAHLMNAVLMLLDSFLIPFPVRILHFVYSNVYGFLYIFATVIVWLRSGKTTIFYDFLDYSNKPELAVIVIFGCFLVVQPLFQLFFYGLFRFRVWLLTKCSRDVHMEVDLVYIG